MWSFNVRSCNWPPLKIGSWFSGPAFSTRQLFLVSQRQVRPSFSCDPNEIDYNYYTLYSGWLWCAYNNAWISNSALWYIAVFMVSALNTSQRTSSSCPRFILASDCVRPPDLLRRSAHFRSQELGHGTRYLLSAPPSLFILATSENFSLPVTTAWITLVTVSWSCSACTQHHVNPGELNWTELAKCAV